ncbi:uncharacterized protein LDX57_006957 [Aspergillus melleus]|uniref:uncharacterized protein n=1 Tax=Aspergillus melleus TaxID=138277 RepID=UPI001E8EE191|nr:uncharacterized protein LDX57_006957 [Aspergillus melleus]KAH8429290.1 hypothetical protein LDX57_006957 [Aspergillus melleus]
MSTESTYDHFDPTEHLLPHIVDHYAASKPDAIYAEFPRCSRDYDQGYHKITYQELAKLVNALARWLIGSIGHGCSFDALAYIGPNDVRYIALALAAAKAGYMMFFPSPRNSATAHAKLLDELQCEIMITPTPCPRAAHAVLQDSGLRVLNVPDVEDLLQANTAPVRYERTLSQALMEPLLTIHTSGSTGLPKPVTLTHASVLAGMRMFALSPPKGRRGQNHLMTGRRLYSMLPPFHGAYLACHLMNAVPFETVMIAPIASGIPSAAGLARALEKTKVDVAILAPSIIEELAKAPDLLKICAQRLECILYAGGDLPQHIGDHVATKIPLYNQFGSTELGLVPLLMSQTPRRSGDWSYLEFHPDLGLEMRPVLGKQYELYAIRNTRLERQQLTFTYPEYTRTAAYPTGDLFVPHPSDPWRWKWVARSDDILVLLNGEKTNPLSTEKQIMQHPQISGALVVGVHRLQPALLLEVNAEQAHFDPNAFTEEVWPRVEAANKDCPAHAQIAKSHILFTDPSAPMRRSGKGTIQRGATTELYAEAINRMYNDADAVRGPVLTRQEAHDSQRVSLFILSAIKLNTGWEGLSLGDDFFDRGMDSLQALNIARALKHGLGIEELPSSLIYRHPNVTALCRVLVHQNNDAGVRPDPSSEGDLLSKRRATLDLYRDIIARIPFPPRNRPTTTGQCVLLTQGTGSLGIYLLHEFLQSPAVQHVYCVVGISGGCAAQSQEIRQHGLGSDLDSRHVTFLQADLSQESMGLECNVIQELREKVTLVVHNEWFINLNRPLAAFSTQLQGLVNLIRFCSSTVALSKMVFVSSIGASLGYQDPNREVPERVIDLNKPAINGYAESRYIAEHLLHHATKRLGICTSIARLTYVPGSTQLPSCWDFNEWLPSLIVGSFHLGALPDSLGPRMSHIDWIPADLLSPVLAELCLDGKIANGDTPIVHHPVNLQPSSWESMLPLILEECHRASFSDIQVIPLHQWLELVRRQEQLLARDRHGHGPGNDIGDRLGRLAHFYQTLLGGQDNPAFPKTNETACRSALLSMVPGIQDGWVRKWMRELILASGGILQG